MSCNDNVEDNFEDFWKIFDEFTQITMLTFSITDIFKLCPAIKAFRVGFCKLVIQIIQKPWGFATNSNFLIIVSLKPGVVDL